jgi:hypothetical protein
LAINGEFYGEIWQKMANFMLRNLVALKNASFSKASQRTFGLRVLYSAGALFASKDSKTCFEPPKNVRSTDN